jgi:hypothetical protein
MLKEKYLEFLRKHVIRFALLAAVPFLLAGLFVLSANNGAKNRYDSRYFSEDYQQRYATAGAVIAALERALVESDTATIAELEGLRQPKAIKTGENIVFETRVGTQGPYTIYLFSDTYTYARLSYHLTEVNGRWVVAPQDSYYLLHSGAWLNTLSPLAVVWWIFELTFILGYGAFLITRRWFDERFLLKSPVESR